MSQMTMVYWEHSHEKGLLLCKTDSNFIGIMDAVAWQLRTEMMHIKAHAMQCLLYATTFIPSCLLDRANKVFYWICDNTHCMIDSWQILVTTNDSRLRLYDLRDLSLCCKYRGVTNYSSQIKASFRYIFYTVLTHQIVIRQMICEVWKQCHTCNLPNTQFGCSHRLKMRWYHALINCLYDLGKNMAARIYNSPFRLIFSLTLWSDDYWARYHGNLLISTTVWNSGSSNSNPWLAQIPLYLTKWPSNAGGKLHIDDFDKLIETHYPSLRPQTVENLLKVGDCVWMKFYSILYLNLTQFL